MLFVLLFVAGMLIVPLMIDIDKHGKDNILARSGKEFLELPVVAPLVHLLGSIQRRFTQAVAIAISIAVIVILVAIVMQLFGLVHYFLQ